MSEKSIIVFSNFWDTNAVIDFRFLFLHDVKNEKLYKINLLKKDNSPENFSVHSIALSHPDFSKEINVKNMNRIDCLCPTYDMLKRYKKDKNWDAYQKDFLDLIKKRKSVIKDWAMSLKPNWVHFLCCWENTSHGAHCHREILHKVFSESKTISNKIISIYRSGEKNYKKNLNGEIYIPASSWGVMDEPIVFDRITVAPNVTTRTYETHTGISNTFTLASSSFVLSDGTYDYVILANGQSARINSSGLVELLDNIPPVIRRNSIRRADDVRPPDPPNDDDLPF